MQFTQTYQLLLAFCFTFILKANIIKDLPQEKPRINVSFIISIELVVLDKIGIDFIKKNVKGTKNTFFVNFKDVFLIYIVLHSK